MLDCVINPSVVADLGSGVPGIIDRVMVDRSDHVEAGQVVAELESGVEIAARDLAQVRAEKDTEIELRRVNAAFGQRQHARSEDLFARKVISTNDRDERKTEARLADIQLRQARDNKELAVLELRRAEQVLKRRSIKSPISGVVMERFKTIGEYVDEQPVLRVAQLDPLFIEVFVPVERLGEVRPGMEAEVWSDAVGDQRWQAQVSRVDRVADVASGTYGVRLVLPNPEYRVPAGLRCRLAFSPVTEPPVATLEQPDTVTSEIPAKPDNAAVEVIENVSSEAADTLTSVPDTADSGHAAVEDKLATPLRIDEAEVSAETDEVAAVPADVAAAQVAEAVMPGPVTEPVCLRSGPYASKTAAGKVARELEQLGLVTRIESHEESEQRGLRVVSRWFNEHSHADAFVTRLKQAGIKDFFVAPGRRLPYRVNLGLYNDERSATKRVADLESKGIDADILAWTQPVTRYQLTVSGEADESLSRHLAELPASKPARCEQLVSQAGH
ncbi:MAG: efflux RND transporter periplasmic adaptor subunit [Gammaproteobacteria bacterium]|nr:efflux RND transporter periplasmic adaptor subunit [Gammaproteobacteria bacterium]